jgi:hypothetical protein
VSVQLSVNMEYKNDIADIATVQLSVNMEYKNDIVKSAMVQRYVRPHYVKHKSVIKHTKVIVCGVL